MKKVLCVFILVCLSGITVYAQYRINKTKYNYHTYSYQKGDPMNPALCCVASIIPGVGQMICGEPGRGLCFLGGFAGSAAFTYAGVAVFATSIPASDSEPVKEGQMLTGLLMVATGIGGIISFDIWSIVDAVHVARITNMAFRDQNKTSLDLKLKPYIGTYGILNSNEEVLAGVTLILTF